MEGFVYPLFSEIMLKTQAFMARKAGQSNLKQGEGFSSKLHIYAFERVLQEPWMYALEK